MDKLVTDEIKKEQLELVLKHLEYSQHEVSKIAEETPLFIFDEQTLRKITRAFNERDVTSLPEVLKDIKANPFKVDNVAALYIGPTATYEPTASYINFLRKQLGKHYPDDLQHGYLTFTAPNGKKLELRIYDLEGFTQLNSIFEQYQKWFISKKPTVGLQYQAIYEELEKWLKDLPEGKFLQEKGFVNWWITNRLSRLGITIENLKFDKQGNLSSGLVNIKAKIQQYAEGLTPYVILEDIIDYCLSKQQSANEARNRVLAKRALQGNNTINQPLDNPHYKLDNPLSSKKAPCTQITILPKARQPLIESLSAYVSIDQQDSLAALINRGIQPNQPIICDCEQVRIGMVFYELVKAPSKKERSIQADKTKIARWIVSNFKRNDYGIVKNLSESTILNYLSGKGFSKDS